MSVFSCQGTHRNIHTLRSVIGSGGLSASFLGLALVLGLRLGDVRLARDVLVPAASGALDIARAILVWEVLDAATAIQARPFGLLFHLVSFLRWDGN
jgi:hypothetical protein